MFHPYAKFPITWIPIEISGFHRATVRCDHIFIAKHLFIFLLYLYLTREEYDISFTVQVSPGQGNSNNNNNTNSLYCAFLGTKVAAHNLHNNKQSKIKYIKEQSHHTYTLTHSHTQPHTYTLTHNK